MAPATPNPHFLSADSVEAARSLIDFDPLTPSDLMGCRLEGIRIHVRDHRMRDLAVVDRTLELLYGRFMVSQSKHDPEEARRRAFDLSYGSSFRLQDIAGHRARVYDHGPEPEAGDPDGQMPAVVVWSDRPMLCLVASHDLPLDQLVRVAQSLYA